MQTKLDFLIERVQKQNPQANIKKIRAAYECAAKAHEGQKRRNGEPYIIHPVAVAEIVVEMGLDTDSICAALLHDCIEDTEFGYKEIENKFGTPVAELVDGVTRLGMLRYSKEQEQFEDLRKMFLAMAKDIRVILIKLADRLHNARTFQFLPERKQRDKAPAAIGPYSQGIVVNGTAFFSGQIPLSPETGEVIGTTIREQTEQVMKNIQGLLESQNASFTDVVKTTCFLADMSDFAAFNEVYAKYFTGKPARSCVAVKDLPKGVLCEVETIAVIEEN